ncbi:MAG: response regulator transcription factor [Chitinophagales bacterium]|nr:response regulator transcription factor [Chitinophagales bacterium]
MDSKDTKVNILLVDDHQIVLDGLKKMLKDNPQYVVAGEAINGQQAIDVIASNPDYFQLVVSDITMPLMNGIDLCRVIKTQYPFIKVIILSMHNSIALVKDALAAEADGYMLKNTGQDEFLMGIDRVINHSAYFSNDILPIILNHFQNGNSTLTKPLLTLREQEVLELIVQELTSKEIADKLHISKQTVDSHRINIMQKTNCKTLVGLMKYAIQSGYIK